MRKIIIKGWFVANLIDLQFQTQTEGYFRTEILSKTGTLMKLTSGNYCK